MHQKISVIVPVNNEEFSIKPLFLSLQQVMDKIGQPYEIIFVDDYSTDGSLEALKQIRLTRKNLAIVSLSKKYGQSLALQAGLDIASGELIITMDGDLQNDPEDIPALLDKMKEGFDVVCGWRYKRNDPWNKILVSRIVSICRRIITREKIHDFGCGLRVFRREAVKDVYLSAGMHRFFSLIMVKLGYKIGEVKVRHYFRRFGKSKYGLRNRLTECLIDFTRILSFGVPKVIGKKPEYKISRIFRDEQ